MLLLCPIAGQLEEVLRPDAKEKRLRLRFGLEDGRARTLEEVVDLWRHRERIRQIAKALRKLRHPKRSKAKRFSTKGRLKTCLTTGPIVIAAFFGASHFEANLCFNTWPKSIPEVSMAVKANM